MVSVNLLTPYELMGHIAQRAREKRLEFNLTQETLAKRSGVSLGALKKFERTGKISIESLLKLALVLEALAEFDTLFSPKPLESYASLKQILKRRSRKRGRK